VQSVGGSVQRARSRYASVILRLLRRIRGSGRRASPVGSRARVAFFRHRALWTTSCSWAAWSEPRRRPISG